MFTPLKKELVPEAAKDELEAGNRRGSLNGGGIIVALGREIGAEDGDFAFVGIDNPSELGAIVEPLLHLAVHVGELVGLGAEFDDEVRTEGGVAGLVGVGERLPAGQGDPGGIGGAHRAVGEGETAVRVEGDAAAVCFGPLVKEATEAHIHLAGNGSGWGHHEYLSVCIAFNPQDFVGTAEAHQLFVGHGGFGLEAQRKRHSGQGEIHG